MYSGLTTLQAQENLRKYGLNDLPEPKNVLIKKIILNIVSPISLMLVVASALSFFVGKVFDGYFIVCLLVLNIFITLWQENKADSAIKKLNEQLQQKALVLRDNSWVEIDSKFITFNDVCKISSGEVVLADSIILDAENVSVNESSLTGESLPKDKHVNDKLYSGSYLASGIAIVKITATGVNTNFGKTIFSVDRIRKVSLLEEDILKMSKFLTVLSLFAVILLTAFFLYQKVPILELLTLDLSLIIAGIPISLPTVITLITELGVIALAKKNVIVRRLSSLEDLSNVNLLLTDKTGTLTQNKIEINDIYAYTGFTHDDVILFAAIVASMDSANPISLAVIGKVKDSNKNIPEVQKISFIPADSIRKRSTFVFKFDNKLITLSFGAPQIIKNLCDMDSASSEKFDQDVNRLAESGYRTLGLAISNNSSEEQHLKIVGLLGLSDTIRVEAKEIIQYLEDNGINVAMVTGDSASIASQISKSLSLDDGRVITKKELDSIDWNLIKPDFFTNVGAFAEIFPEDKLLLVEKAKKFFTVASNGDGVNDLPAIKAANVGIAVSNAVNSLKAAADIVLLSPGIGVIRDAILESRKIFERINTYALYRVSESFRLVITIAILGIIFRAYPLSPLQIILLAFLNDIPIISLAFDRVKTTSSPSKMNIKKQLVLSSLFGLVGVGNSMLLIIIVRNYLHLSWEAIQTLYFLKLTVSGHMLVFVAHTKEKWFKFLPSKEVIIATLTTQFIASAFAFTGFLMPAKVSLVLILFIWIWSFCWMQISELVKRVRYRF